MEKLRRRNAENAELLRQSSAKDMHSEILAAVKERKAVWEKNATHAHASWDVNFIPKEERWDSEFVFQTAVGTEFSIQQKPWSTLGKSQTEDYGSTVWTAAIALSRFLEHHYKDDLEMFSGKRVLELGAGTGLVSIVAASMGAHVTSTDQPACLGLLEQNAMNAVVSLDGSIHVEELTWGLPREDKPGDAPAPYDFVLGSDLVYHPSMLDAFISTIESVVLPGTTMWLAYDKRGRAGIPQFFQMMSESSTLVATELSMEHQHPNFRYKYIGIVKITCAKGGS